MSPTAKIDRTLALLHRRLGSKVLSSDESCAPYRTDDCGIEGRVDAVVLAQTSEDIRRALEVADATGTPVTPRAGGSGRTGGAVPIEGGIVLCTRGMNCIVDLDEKEGTVVVQPGVILADLHRAVESSGWFYPPDPNSAEVCCIGGNLAENAAGPRALKYGATRDYVLGVQAFLSTNEQFFSGRRTKKGVTGYDTTALLVGSEGTLAVLGETILRLVPKPESVMTLLATFASFVDATEAVARIISARIVPRCLEFLDEKTLQIMRQGVSAFDANARALLLIEVDGGDAECLVQAERVSDACERSHVLSVKVAQTDSQRTALWEVRKSMSIAVRSRARNKLSEDVVVPRHRLGELVETVERLADEQRIDALCYGHAGDGNLHVNFLWDDPDQKDRVDRAIVRLFESTVQMGGTLSGEHGIGLLKAPFLAIEQSEEQIRLQRRLKAAFDPKGLLNPGKIFPCRGHGSC